MKNTFRPKKINWVTFFSGLFLFLSLAAKSQSDTTTAFISDLVRFYEQRCGQQLTGKLFTEFASDTPYINLYLSKKEHVENAIQSAGYFISCKNNLYKAKRQDSLYRDRYETFIYTSQANVNTYLTTELLTYRRETQAFIVFHELTHVYLSQLHAKYTYTVGESLCDLVGNYLTREYAMSTKKINIKVADAQLLLNEQLLTLINSIIVKIDNDPSHKQNIHTFCEKDLKRYALKMDSFQKKRYVHPVNNAYLYRNSFYSENYFDLKTKILVNRQLPKDFRDILNR